MSGLYAVETPVATRYQRPSGRWRLLMFGGLLTIAVIGASVAATAMLWRPDDSRNPIVAAGTVAELRTGEPRYFEREGFYVVKLETGEVIALSDADPRTSLGHEGCGVVPWVSDFTMRGVTGWFREPCWGSTYYLNGQIVSGPSPRSMDRYMLTIEGDVIRVDTRRRFCQDFEGLILSAEGQFQGAGVIDEDCDGASD